MLASFHHWIKRPRLAALCAGLLLLTDTAFAGQIDISRTGGLYNVVVNDAPLEDVLDRINRLEPVELRFFGDLQGRVNVVYRNITLDELLYRLRISYMLVYQQDADGNFYLHDSMLGQGVRTTLSAEERARVLELIRDLAHDETRLNAHYAYWELQRMSCDILPLLEQALYVDDYQGRHLAAHIIRRMDCPEYEPSTRLLELTIQLLGRDQYDSGEYWSLFGPATAFEYLHARKDLHDRVRLPLIDTLNRGDPQARFLAAALLAERGESGLAGHLVAILAPHLADNDLPTDGGVAAHALYSLGPAALPHLAPYRRSTDQQQAELAELVATALETGEVPDFKPEMYAGQTINPLDSRTRPRATHWRLDQFPDALGRYHGLRETRLTTEDHYPQQHYTPPSGYPEALFPYTVRSGDTLELIVRDFTLEMEDLLTANPDIRVNEDGTLPRQTILIPPARP